MSAYYVFPRKPDEIYHYGMPERSGRYAWGSGDRPYQRLEGRVRKVENKLKKRLDTADKRVKPMQDRANKKYQEAVKKSNSFFYSEKSAQKAFEKAMTAQKKVNKEEYRAAKQYLKSQKLFNKLNVTMTDDLQKRGQEYYNRVVESSKETYLIALGRRMG